MNKLIIKVQYLLFRNSNIWATSWQTVNRFVPPNWLQEEWYPQPVRKVTDIFSYAAENFLNVS